ncbi:MAG: hypothetical protein WC813_02360 [Patescibacteria group bacterium]|jgi:hypothetical protein
MATTIKKLKPKGGFEINDKRFKIPVHVTSTCPHCGKSVKKKLDETDGESYLSFPKIGVPIDLNFWHYFEGNKHAEADDHEWTVRVILDFTLTLTPEQK